MRLPRSIKPPGSRIPSVTLALAPCRPKPAGGGGCFVRVGVRGKLGARAAYSSLAHAALCQKFFYPLILEAKTALKIATKNRVGGKD